MRLLQWLIPEYLYNHCASHCSKHIDKRGRWWVPLLRPVLGDGEQVLHETTSPPLDVGHPVLPLTTAVSTFVYLTVLDRGSWWVTWVNQTRLHLLTVEDNSSSVLLFVIESKEFLFVCVSAYVRPSMHARKSNWPTSPPQKKKNYPFLWLFAISMATSCDAIEVHLTWDNSARALAFLWFLCTCLR